MAAMDKLRALHYLLKVADTLSFSRAAQAFGVPYLDIRALSDLAGKESRFDFARFVDEVAASSARILRRLLASL